MLSEEKRKILKDIWYDANSGGSFAGQTQLLGEIKHRGIKGISGNDVHTWLNEQYPYVQQKLQRKNVFSGQVERYMEVGGINQVWQMDTM